MSHKNRSHGRSPDSKRGVVHLLVDSAPNLCVGLDESCILNDVLLTWNDWTTPLQTLAVCKRTMTQTVRVA